MLVGPRDEAINVQALVCDNNGQVRLYPRLLMDGRYALPDQVIVDPEYSAAIPILSDWQHVTLSSSDFVHVSHRDLSSLLIEVDDKLMWQLGRRSSLTMPNPDVFRFEVHADDFAVDSDAKNGNRRSEIISEKSQGVGEGTAWTSLCLVLGDTPGLTKTTHGIIHQWHSDDIDFGRSPVLSVNVASDGLQIRTCSSALLYGGSGTGTRNPQNGIFVVHHTSSVPVSGEKTYIVMQAIFGENGHLNTWINGTQVVDDDTPIGYYDDLTDGSGRTVLGYPQCGLYTTNQPDTDIVYVANFEWGTTSLSGRVRTPLPVPDLAW